MNPRMCLVVAGLIGVLAANAFADGPFRRRVVSSPSYCPPAHHDLEVIQAEVIEADVLAAALLDQQASASQAIVVQNNYNGAPLNLGSTLYGYAADPLTAPLTAPQRYNPYQVDPAGMLRESVRMTDRTSDLMQQSLEAYHSLGTLALQSGAQADTIRAQTEQLRAQAELIRSTTPPQIVAHQVERLTTSQQRLTSGTQAICIEPDGRGGFTIRLDGAQESTADTSQPLTANAAAGQSVLQARCASCHTGASSKGEFAMFDDTGGLALTSTEQLERIIERSRAGSMPPEPAQKLTDRELAALVLMLPD